MQSFKLVTLLFCLSFQAAHANANCFSKLNKAVTEKKAAIQKYFSEVRASYGARLLIKKSKELAPPQAFFGLLTEHKANTKKWKEAPLEKTFGVAMNTLQMPMWAASAITTKLKNGKVTRYDLSPINGVARYLSRQHFKGNNFFKGEHQFSIPAYLAILLYAPIPGPLQNVMNSIDPFYHLLMGLISANEELDEYEEKKLLELLILHDPRFEEIKLKLQDGIVKEEHTEAAKKLMLELQAQFEIMLSSPRLEMSESNYQEAFKLLQKQEVSEEELNNLSPELQQFFFRMQLLDHPAYSYLLEFTDPNWVSRKKEEGFNVGTGKQPAINLESLEGIKVMDQMIQQRSNELLDYDFIKELSKSNKLPKGLSENPPVKAQAEKVLNSRFYMELYALKSQGKISEGQLLENLMNWTKYKHHESLYEQLDIYIEDVDGSKIDLPKLEDALKSELSKGPK